MCCKGGKNKFFGGYWLSVDEFEELDYSTWVYVGLRIESGGCQHQPTSSWRHELSCREALAELWSMAADNLPSQATTTT